MIRLAASVVLAIALLPAGGAAQTVAGCGQLPPDNVWNSRVDDLPRHADSDAWVATIGATGRVHPDFGAGVWPPGSTSPIGIPWIDIAGTQTKVPVSFTWPGESDPGPYPIPPTAPIEGGPDSTGDRHVLVVDRDNCVLYELYAAWPQNGGTSWQAGSGAIYDLASNALRPDGWTSADAAGLPILPGLVRPEEVAAGEIRHAIRFTAPETADAHIWPARHDASNNVGSQYPPMGARFRLKRDFDIAGFPAEVQVILVALKRYGMILADNGSAWYLSGVPSEGWNNDALSNLHDVPGSAFEAVDASSLIIDVDSGRVARIFSDDFETATTERWNSRTP